MNLRLLMISISILTVTSCATMSDITNADVSYLETARQNFDAGEKALKESKFDEALAFFDHVRNKYPYSKYAGESDLKVADTYFAQEKWLEAADSYEFFIKFHPVHENLAYAFFRVAEANYNAMPSNFFLFPKRYAKDQTVIKDTLEAINRYLDQFPKDQNAQKAREMKIEMREQMALQHIHVASFYAQRKKWKGARQRYEEVVNTYADTPSARRAALDLGLLMKTHMNNTKEAKELLLRLVKEHPDSVEAKEAGVVLKDFPSEDSAELSS